MDSALSKPFSAALILGGKSSRMGTDKAWLEVDNRRTPLWQRQFELLQELRPAEIFFSGEPRGPYPKSLDWVPDAVPSIGPLGGLVSCLRQCKTEWLLILAVDLPRMTAELAQQMVDARQPGKGIVPVVGSRFEPLIAVYSRLALDLAERHAASGQYRMQDLAGELVSTGLSLTYPVRSEDEPLFVNWNTPADRRGDGSYGSAWDR
jgi:molybdopterin-guanine dinucleotide biosynthesis protein A